MSEKQLEFEVIIPKTKGHTFGTKEMFLSAIGGPKEFAIFVSNCRPQDIQEFFEALSVAFKTKNSENIFSEEDYDVYLRNSFSFWVNFLCKEPLKKIIDFVDSECVSDHENTQSVPRDPSFDDMHI